MSGISSPGVGSGLPIAELVSQLVAVETNPVKSRIDLREARMSTELSILGQIKGSLAKLQDTLLKLSDIKQFYGFSANISDTSVLGAKLNDTAQPGSYQITVEQLATRQSLASAAVGDPGVALGSGVLTIEFGTYSSDKSTFTANPEQDSLVITIDNGQDSLQAIRDQINNNGGVTASIIYDSQGAHLTLASPDTGENMAMRIQVTDNDGNDSDNGGLSSLSYDPTSGINNMFETVAAQNSEIYINGLFLSNYHNVLENVVDGIDLTLKKADPDTPVTLNVSADKTKMTDAVNQFVKQYNETMGILSKFTGYNTETEEGAYLQGDAALRSLKNSLSSWVNQRLNTEEALQSIADIGVYTNRDGSLGINLDTFNEVLDKHYEEIGALFAKTGTVSDSNLRIRNIDRTVKAGHYAINIDTYTPGSLLTGTIAGIYANSPDGQVLTGTGAFKGLEISVLGGSTGDRGTLDVHDGLAVRLDDILESFLGTQGTFAARSERLSKGISNLSKERDALSTRAEILEKRYLQQFTALDSLISQMQTTSQFLTQQLAILPDLKIKSR